MNLFKIIAILFLIYFIRRFIQMYKALRVLQMERESHREHAEEKNETVDAEFKVID